MNEDKETGSYEETKRDTSNRLELAVASPSPESKQIKRPLQITHSIWHRMGNDSQLPTGACVVCVLVCEFAIVCVIKRPESGHDFLLRFFHRADSVDIALVLSVFRALQSDSHKRDFRSLHCYIWLLFVNLNASQVTDG